MGEIVSFYSFKGGTGRSTCLSNVAFELAKRGETVGCMDFDLSAPGLHMIYDIGPNRRARTKSIHDYLGGNKKTQRELSDYVLDVQKSYRDTDFEGKLLLMPGDINPQVAAEMADDSQREFANIQDLVRDFETEYNLDYVFLDSRSGISNQAMPIFQASDHLLTFSKWTHQHKLGTYQLLDWIGGVISRDPRYFDKVLGIGSNVPPEVTDEDVADWVDSELPPFVGETTAIHESEILKKEEKVVIDDHSDRLIADEYKIVADLIQQL